MYNLSLDETKDLISFFVDKFSNVENIISEKELSEEIDNYFPNEKSITPKYMTKTINYKCGKSIKLNIWYVLNIKKFLRKDYIIMLSNSQQYLIYKTPQYELSIESNKTFFSRYSLEHGLLLKGDNTLMTVDDFNKNYDTNYPLDLNDWTTDDITHLRLMS